MFTEAASDHHRFINRLHGGLVSRGDVDFMSHLIRLRVLQLFFTGFIGRDDLVRYSNRFTTGLDISATIDRLLLVMIEPGAEGSFHMIVY